MRSSILYTLLSIGTCLLDVAAGGVVLTGKVYCHYLVGVISAEDALADVEEAALLGIDAFALNVGDATLSWVQTSLHNLFDAAVQVSDFKLFISMDVYASGAACYAGGSSCNGPYDYADIFSWAFDSSAYEMGPTGVPLVSTFSASNFDNTEWLKWRNSMTDVIYFCPDFDATDGYYNGTDALPGWWYYWGDVVDCVFSWETAWPKRGTPVPDTNPNIGNSSFSLYLWSDYEGDVTMDEIVQAGALGQSPVKGYMMGLSSIQYKNSYGSNVYRSGGLNLPARMDNILKMGVLSDFIEIQTWNDGPEAHNIGNLWSESNSDVQPSLYMKEHKAWQPLIASFITTWKQGGKIADMRVPNYLTSGEAIGAGAVPDVGTGAMWYRPLPMDAECLADDGTENQSTEYGFWEKPYGFDSGEDAIYWAFVLEPAYAGSTLEIYSGGTHLGSSELSTGLNYAQTTVRYPGAQYMQLVSTSGEILMSAYGGECVYESTECPRGIYDMNVEVLAFTSGSPNKSCSYPVVPSEPKAPLPTLPSGYPAGLGISWLEDVPECVGVDEDILSADCFAALDVRAEGYLYLHSSCTSQEGFILSRNFLGAYDIAEAADGFPADDDERTLAEYYMGPDWESFPLIAENIQRAADFHSKSGNNYITITCKDVKNWCPRKLNGKTIGGYAWTDRHWYTWDQYYIHMCPIFFTGIDNLSDKLEDMKDSSHNNDLGWLQSRASYLLHEMMHTNIISWTPPNPQIIDVPVDPQLDKSQGGAYMPKFVRMLAKRPISQGGGATRASINSDSYTQLMNAIYWNGETGVLPLVPGYPLTSDNSTSPPADESDDLPGMLYLGDMTNMTDAEFDAQWDVSVELFNYTGVTS